MVVTWWGTKMRDGCRAGLQARSLEPEAEDRSGRFRGLAGTRFRRRLLAAGNRLGAELLGESFYAALGVDQLLPSRKKRMTVRADFQVQLFLGRARLPRRAAGAAGLDVV